MKKGLIFAEKMALLNRNALLLLGRRLGSAFHSSALCWSKDAVPSQLWQVGKLNHVAIAVPDLTKASQFYKDVLGAKVSDPEKQADHGVYTVFVELGDTKIELLHPLGDKSPIQNFLDKNKNGGMHHICIEVSDIKSAMEDLKQNSIRTLGSEPKIGAHGKLVIFLHPKDCCGTLVELEQDH